VRDHLVTSALLVFFRLSVLPPRSLQAQIGVCKSFRAARGSRVSQFCTRGGLLEKYRKTKASTEYKDKYILMSLPP
jgi:hypothetical protein